MNPLEYIYRAMGWVLEQLYNLLDKIGIGNYALAIVLFTLLVNVVFLPFSIKQQKSMSKQTALKPRLDALKEKCGDDRQRYQTEMQALYQKENVSMMGGCWTLLIRLPFLWGVWRAIQRPLTYIFSVSSSVIEKAKEVLPTLIDKDLIPKGGVDELTITQHADKLVSHDPTAFAELANADSSVFTVFGIDLTLTPHFDFGFNDIGWIWLIPILSFATAMLSSVITMKMQKKTNPQGGGAGGMMLMMPFLSLWIAFTVPGAVGFYWACSNLANMIIQICMHRFYGPYVMIAREEAKMAAARKEREKELIQSKEV